VGIGVGGTRWIMLQKQLSQKGATVHANSLISSARGGDVTVSEVYGGADTALADVDAIVVVGDSVANDELFRELVSGDVDWQVISVGDCVAPRRLEMAVLEGHRAARTI
jgi:hypothetical protein